MKLMAYQYAFRQDVQLKSASHKRQWMDATPHHFAYRCLPLVIANSHGWEILCPCNVTARWIGGAALDKLTVMTETQLVSSHFGSGILTFMVPYLFRTDPGINLMVQGPMNRPKDGIQALSAVVETDWAIAPFTMNWKFTRSCEVKFEKDEPYCHIFPIARTLQTVDPCLARLPDEPELCSKFIAWGESRGEYGKVQTEDTTRWHWQKHYHLGQDASGEPIAPDDHQQKLTLAEFE